MKKRVGDRSGAIAVYKDMCLIDLTFFSKVNQSLKSDNKMFS